MGQDKFYSIAEVTDLTGATEFLLRAWELRYGLVKPQRTETGRRLYSSQDVLKISKVVTLTQRGFRVGKLARLKLEELNLLASLEAQQNASDSKEELLSQAVQKVFALIAHTDWWGVKAIFIEQKRKLGPLKFLNQFILPVCHELSTHSNNQTIDIIQEHILSSLVKEHLYSLQGAVVKKATPYLIIFATAEGDHHDLGLLISKVTAELMGFKTIYLGPHIPKKELVEACMKLNPTHLVVSSSLTDGIPKAENFLKYAGFLDQHLPTSTTVWLGGVGVQELSLNLKREFEVFRDFNSYKERLAFLLQ